MSDRHADFSSAEPDGYREAAALVVSKLAALIPLKDTIAATKNGQTFVDYFSAALASGAQQRALIDALTAALEFYADEVMAYSITQVNEPRSAVHGDRGRIARAALAAAKEQSA